MIYKEKKGISVVLGLSEFTSLSLGDPKRKPYFKLVLIFFFWSILSSSSYN